MDIDLRIILLAIGALFVIGLILVDRIKRKKSENMPYKRFSESNDFELPSMSTSDDVPSHEALDELRIDETVETASLKSIQPERDFGDDFSGEPDIDDEAAETSNFAEMLHVESDDTFDESTSQEEVLSESGEDDEDHALEEITDEAESELTAELVLSLLVLAPKGEQFRGSQIKMALKEAGFTFGAMDIFHLLEGDETLVSVANVLEPGFFVPKELASFKTPGLVVFSQLPATLSGEALFAKWCKAAKKINVVLGGRLTDLNQKPLDRAAFDKLREQAEAIPATHHVAREEDRE
ncbi:MAG: hypothetical protein OEL79_02325 [Chromatiales bacterium]|nr:hypothetical protein [Chromatiales bacterium]